MWCLINSGALSDREEGPGGDDRVVDARGLRKAYHISRPSRDVIAGVSFSVRRGEFVALMGPSGCGKSTLLHVLGGLEPPDQGSVTIDGRNLYAMGDGPRSAYRRDHIGLVFQFFNLIPSLSAAENVALPLRLRGDGGRQRSGEHLSRAAVAQRVSTLMDQLNLHRLQGHGPEEISGGEQQRVALARALALAPSLILADEPTGNLDWEGGHEVMRLLSLLTRQQRQTTIVVTHDARIAAYAGRVLIMQDGRIIDDLAGDGDTGTGPPPSTLRLVSRLSQLGL